MAARRRAPLAPVRPADPLDALCAYTAARPLLSVRWTPPQHEFLACDAPRKLLRAGNQIGKTWAGLAEVIYRALGTHPYLKTRPPPVEIWVVCTTWPQSVGVMKKFWELVPKDAVRSPQSFDPRYGFGKDNPAVVFRNGSIVRFRTTNQGAEALAGATIDFVLIDEPTDEDIYRELDRRLTRTAGALALTLTPVNRPTEYLRALTESGCVADLHHRMTPDAFVPLGSRGPLTLPDGTPLDAAWIAAQRKLVLPRYEPVVIDGEWECRVGEAVFPAFDRRSHVKDVRAAGYRLHVGWDHGEGDYREVAVLVGVDCDGPHPRVAVLAEYAGDGLSTPDVDAEGVIDALAAAGVEWGQLRGSIGDKPTQGRLSRRSNADLERALAREIRRRGGSATDAIRPPIAQAKTGRGGGAGSLWRGAEWLHRAMLRPGHFAIHPRCERTILSLERWDGGRDSEWKDACDALRYGVWPYAIKAPDVRVAEDWRSY